ncbi:MAG TPA: gamma-glutamylcyclotransferase family protein [Pseudolabrys sp.]|nr:gamma-glutamylcyclotransferase family protein [Pseudolabrys sp.]
MTRHFAYGANMDRAAMRQRCPGARSVGPAVLEGHRFTIGLDGWASVAPRAGETVHGVLWQLTPRDVAALHAFELLHQGLYDVHYLVVRHGSHGLRAMTYVLRRLGTGRPRPGYIEAIAAAARSWELPEPYIRGIERWSVARRMGPHDAGMGAGV